MFLSMLVKAALDAERRSSLKGQRRLDAIFTSSVDAICVINEQGIVEAFNRTAEKQVLKLHQLRRPLA